MLYSAAYRILGVLQRKSEVQWIADERKAANLDQRLKSLIMSVLPDDQMNSDFQDSPDDEDDTKISHKYLNDLEKEYQARALLAKSKRAKLALFNSSDSTPSSSSGKNRGLIAETYDWDEEEVSSDENEVTEVKVLMALTDEERVSVGKESARNGEWIKIFMKNVHTLLEMEDNDDRKSFLDYLCIDLNYVKEQRNNLMSKHKNLVQELNTCKEQLLVLKQSKLDLLTMQHVNTKILKVNQNLRNELKELSSITEAWLNSSNKVNQCISEQIPTQKKKILGIDQLTKDTFSSGPKDLIFVKSSVDNVSITDSNKHRISKAEDSTLSNHNTGKVPSVESQRNTTDTSIVVTESSATNYDSTDESSVGSTPLPPLKKLDGIIINESSSAPARGNKSFLASKTNSAPAGKLKNVKMEDDPPLAIVMKELNELKLQISKNKSSYSRNRNTQQIKQSERGISINQENYVKDLLKKYDINGSSVKTPMVPPNKLGPDLNGKAVNETQYKANPKESHLITVKRIFMYLKGTASLGLWYPKCSGFNLKGYLDFDYVGCNMDRKSTSCACQLLGGKLVCWSAKKQQSVAMFTAKAEDVVVAAECCANILWIKSLLTDYEIIYEKIKNHILKEDIEFHFIPTQYQLADIFIKPLDEPSFKRLIDELALENSKVSFSIPTGGIYGEVGINTFKNAIGAHYLPYSSEYVAPPSIDVVRQWFPTISYREEVCR
ncbi:hypothetical protein Tco_0979360 [Tanacetum coccineum]